MDARWTHWPAWIVLHKRHILSQSVWTTHFKSTWSNTVKCDHFFFSYLNTAERTSCADSSVCSHTRQALRGKETYGALCIHFGSKIAKPAPTHVHLWHHERGSNELETSCLPWHSTRACQHIPWLWHFSSFFCMNLISTSAVLSCLHCF